MLLTPVLLLTSLGALVAPDTTRYVVVNHGRPAGEMLVVRDGASLVVRYYYTDRNRGQRVETRYRLTARGEVLAAEARPLGADFRVGDVTERFEVAGDSVRWQASRGGGGRGGSGGGPAAAAFESGAFYGFRGGGTPYEVARLASYLLGRPGRAGRTVPGGEVRLEIVADTSVVTRDGRPRVRLVMIHGRSPVPNGIWIDERGELFATGVAWFITVRPGGEAALPTLRAVEVAWRNAQAEALARRLMPPVPPTLVIRNGDLFDSERAVMRPRTSIVVRGDRIVAVGPADSVAVPRGATVVDATGKTVMPGLWEMHGHFQLTSQSTGMLSQLATGITTVRDLAADTDVAVSLRDRVDLGLLVGPRAVLAGFIEGPGAWAGPSDVIVRTEDEARAAVARYDSLGYRQIKLYNLVHPDLVPVIAAEAHRHGMILSGHIPRGLSLPAAVALGFDEINHAAFLFSTFFQDSLYAPQMRAYSAVASVVAPGFDVDGVPMTALIDVLRRRGTVIDGTFNLWMGGAGVLSGEGSPAAASYARLLKRLYEAGVTIVAGTDNNSGSTFITELQLYEHAGIPAPQVLRLATYGAARVMRDDRDYGSIAPGKVADILVVGGRPAERIEDLRKLERVIRAGRVYDPGQLRAALAPSPVP
jgi:imidazolonepropionase-like amidohydrolase